MNTIKRYIIVVTTISFWLLVFSCQQPNQKTDKKEVATGPNILWLVAEDLSPIIPPFGDSTVQTPNLSRLAAEGVRYTNVYSVSGVCSPSRACLATGMYPSSIGAHHMRTLRQQPESREKGLIDYEVVLPPHVKMVSETLREHGYYCTNNSKTDYQFMESKMAWDESSNYAHWRNGPGVLDEGKPFFSIFNFFVTHEGQVWAPMPPHNYLFPRDVFPPVRDEPLARTRFEEGIEKELSIPSDLEVNIPPYLPTTPKSVKDVRRVYSNIVEMDQHVGKVLSQLEEDGLLENTIIVWYSDHGGPLPRQKRLLYDSGLQVPMIIRYPKKRRAGEIDDQLISFVDFAPTLLSMANVEPPQHMQGRAFDGNYDTSPERTYVHAAADRFDEHYDMIRAVRDKRFKYLKNYNLDQGYYLPVAYREQMGIMQELLRLRDEGNLDEYQKQWFRDSKQEEELFDTANDPHELHNLANDPNYRDQLVAMRIECQQWWEEIDDMGKIPETEIITQFWPDKEQPVTPAPVVKRSDGLITVTSQLEGSSIGYKYEGDKVPGLGWRPYNGAIKVEDGQKVVVIAHRIGYAPSEEVNAH